MFGIMNVGPSALRLLATCGLLILALNGKSAGKENSFYSSLTMRDGLPSNIISGIAQDKYDFLWIATGSGLVRYDGYQFKVFKKSESPNSLPFNEMSVLLAWDDFIWVGTWNGLCKINVKTFDITRIDIGVKAIVRTMYKGKNDILWIGTHNGLIRYDIKANERKIYTCQNSGLSHNTVRTIYEDTEGNLWVGTYDKLNKLPRKEERFTTFDLKGAYRPSLPNHLILDIKPDRGSSGEKLWIGTETGLYRMNTTAGSFEHFGARNTDFSNEVIKCIYTDDTDKLWLGTDFGLNIFDPATRSVEVDFHNPRLPYTIANNVIWQIFEDRSGVIWLATSNGLSRVNKDGSFYEYHEVSHVDENQLIGNQIRSVLVSSAGIYWLGTVHGVIRIDPKTNSSRILDISSSNAARNNVFALEEDQFGRIWIGTAGGINIWDDNRQKMHAVAANGSNGLTSNYIGNFTKTADGRLWVSVWEGGLFQVENINGDPTGFSFRPIKGLESGSEKNVAGGGYIWVIEFDELYRIDPETFAKTHIKSFSEASEKETIYSVYFSKAGHLWAGTVNGVIQYLPNEDRSVFHPVTTGNDLIISSIIEDKKGNIWSASNTSLQKFYTQTQTTEIYPLDKDLPLKSFYYGCAAIAKNGQIVFGGDNGYIILSPEKAKPNFFNSRIYITAIEINNHKIAIDDKIDGRPLLQKDVPFTENLTLNYAQRSVSFEFASLHFWQPAMNIFAYRLEGLEDRWNRVSGSKNFAVYSNLPAGEYTFMVKGSNNYGIESDHVAKLRLKIKPPVLLSKGFILLYTILITGGIFYALRIYSARMRLKNELKIVKMEKEHAEEIERTKERFFTNISHELRTPISLILPPIHEIQKKGKLDPESSQLISLAEKNSARLLRLVNQILDFNKLENEALQVKVAQIELVSFCREIFSLFTDQAQRQRIDFRFQSTHNACPAWVDAEKIEAALFNLLSNAFKFTPEGGNIAVELDAKENSPLFQQGEFEITIKDSGIGISAKDQGRIFERFYQSEEGKKRSASSGIGLTMVAEYVALHKGKIEVDSEPGKGTAFTIRLPLGKLHLSGDPVNEKAIAPDGAGLVDHQDEGRQPYHLAAESDKPLILIVEDNHDIVEFIRVSLAEKYNFIVAQNGEEGLEKARNFRPEAIISDIMMPVMDGLSLCDQIKANPDTSHIMVILLTAKSLDAHRLEGIRRGADVYIAKPFEIDLLDAHMVNLLNRKKELTHYFRTELVSRQDEPDSKENADNKFIKRVMDIIEANIGDSEFGVERISREIGMSSTHLYRKLKALTNRSPQDIIKKYRIKKASLMLQNNEGNVSETMYKVGFSSLSYFSKCFKSEFGLTPKEYQQQMTAKSVELKAGE